MAYRLGSYTYSTKKEVTRRVSSILHDSATGVPLSGEVAAVVGDLFKSHPEYTVRTKTQLPAHFVVSWSKGGTRCFYAVYPDGKLDDFSTKRAVAALVDTL